MSPSKTLTGRMAAAFIDSKLTILVMLAALAFGLWSVMTTPREENPQITMPAAGVRVFFMKGTGPQRAEPPALKICIKKLLPKGNQSSDKRTIKRSKDLQR